LKLLRKNKENNNNLFALLSIIILGVCNPILENCSRYNEELDGQGSIPGSTRFFLLYSVQTGSGAHPAFYQMGIGGSYPGGKAAEA
jgi:hypothetical protein